MISREPLSTIIGLDLIKSWKQWGYGRVRFHEKPGAMWRYVGDDQITIGRIIIFPLLSAQKPEDPLGAYVIDQHDIICLMPKGFVP
jgi:hypothetical protein